MSGMAKLSWSCSHDRISFGLTMWYLSLNSTWSRSSSSPNFGSLSWEGLITKFLAIRRQDSLSADTSESRYNSSNAASTGTSVFPPRSHSGWRCLQSTSRLRPRVSVECCQWGYSDLTLDLFCCCLLYTSPSPRDGLLSRMPSSA